MCSDSLDAEELCKIRERSFPKHVLSGYAAKQENLADLAAPVSSTTKGSIYRMLHHFQQCYLYFKAGCGAGQPGLVVDTPAHVREVEDDHCGPF